MAAVMAGGWRQPREEVTPAWLVGEGDQLVGGPVVIAVHREAVSGSVRISTTTQPRGVWLRRNTEVRISRRAR